MTDPYCPIHGHIDPACPIHGKSVGDGSPHQNKQRRAMFAKESVDNSLPSGNIGVGGKTPMESKRKRQILQADLSRWSEGELRERIEELLPERNKLAATGRSDVQVGRLLTLEQQLRALGNEVRRRNGHPLMGE